MSRMVKYYLLFGSASFLPEKSPFVFLVLATGEVNFDGELKSEDEDGM